MNKHQITGTAKDLAGKVQEEAGKLVGSKAQEAKGIHNQVTGKAEKRLGDAKEIVKDAKAAAKDAAETCKLFCTVTSAVSLTWEFWPENLVPLTTVWTMSQLLSVSHLCTRIFLGPICPPLLASWSSEIA